MLIQSLWKRSRFQSFPRRPAFAVRLKQLSGKPLLFFGRKALNKGFCRLLVHIVSLRRAVYAGDAIQETGCQFLEQKIGEGVCFRIFAAANAAGAGHNKAGFSVEKTEVLQTPLDLFWHA